MLDSQEVSELNIANDILKQYDDTREWESKWRIANSQMGEALRRFPGSEPSERLADR